MKLIIKSLFILFTAIAANSANAQVIYGHCVIQNATLDELTCFGPADINNSMIKGKLSITGPLNMNKVDVQTLEVKGPLDINNSIVHTKAALYGPITASNTQFMNDIYAATNQMKLTQTTVKGDINIRSEQDQPIVDMKEHAIVYGNVGFTLKEGLVKLSNDSEIKGSINNGKKAEENPVAKTDTKPEDKNNNSQDNKPAG